MALLDEARSTIPEDLEAELLPRYHFQRGSIWARAGDLRRAEEDLARVRRDAFSDAEWRSVLLTRGLVHAELGRAREAEALFRDAKEKAAAAGDESLLLTAQHDEAYAVYLSGDLPRAHALMSAANRSGEHHTPSIAFLDHALVLIDSGLVDEALGMLRQAAAPPGAPAKGHTLAEIHLESARAFRLVGDARSAGRAVARSRRAYHRLGLPLGEANAQLLQLQIWLDGGKATAAMARDADALVAVGTQHRSPSLVDRASTVAAEAYVGLGDVHRAAGRLASASEVRARSLQGELHRAAVKALVEQARGDLPAARRSLSRGARLLARGQLGSASLDLRTATAVHGVRLARLDLDLALPAGAPAVLASLERWQSATDRLPGLRPPDDPLQQSLTDELRSLVHRLRQQPDVTTVAQTSARVADLQRRIRARDWALAKGTSDRPVPVDLASARALLNERDRTCIWLFVHGGRVKGVVTADGRTRLVDVMDLDAAIELSTRARADLGVLAAYQLGPLGGAVVGSLRATMTALDDLVLRPWHGGSGGLVLVPCRQLAGLPWALAPSMAGRPLTVARSLGGWARRTGSTEEVPALHVSVGPRLERAPEEAAAIAATWRAGSVVEVASPARAAGLVDAVTSADIVHVAAHGTHEPQSPLFSSIELDDGPVFAHEFQPRGIRAKHVVLSACDVGTATVRPGEESLGLAASMLSLGAASVVAAISPVPDDVACEVMTAHHRHLAAGRSTDEALALAIAAHDPVAAAFHSMGSQWRFGSPTA